jgi:UDP:flavonoid glycosyltransferase YjiC (YdhE family)
VGAALAQRGHEVWLETDPRWRPDAEREGVRVVGAPDLPAAPVLGRGPLGPYEGAARTAQVTRRVVRELAPDAVVADVLSVAAGLAAELEGRRWATLVPHLVPLPEPGLPPFSCGARRPRTRAGRAAWAALDPVWLAALRRGRDQLNAARRLLGLAPLPHLLPGLSRALTLVATFPQLEYPRAVRLPFTRVTGPILWEPASEPAPPPEGDGPLAVLAPSTSRDPHHRLLRAALEGLAGEPLRVLAVLGGRPLPTGARVPANARVVPWASYGQTMPRASVVVCHGGHGTLARALASGVPVLACPAGGDMAENGARLRWAGVGGSLLRPASGPRGIRRAVRRLLEDRGAAERAGELARWSAVHDGAEAAADELERFMADEPEG